MSLRMNNNRHRSMFALTLVATILFQALVSFACGPFSLQAVFSFKFHPAFPLEKFARGDVGVVRSSYARSYLYVAYRYFNGGNFNPAEQQSLVDLWRDRIEHRNTSGEENWIGTWRSAREKFLAGTPPTIDVYRRREKPNDYETYLNCQQDAFETAAATLEARAKTLGADNLALKQWIEAQDQVFANCSEGQHIPAALPASAGDLLRTDRDYQIASANFYAGNFDLAKTQFESIAIDAKSPWRTTAPYLVARTLIRKASLGPDETKKASLTEAEERLNKIAADSGLEATHAAARRLLNIVRIRLHPEERLHELGVSLASKTDPATLKQDLWDYTFLLDQISPNDEAHHLKLVASPVDLHDDDLTDWLVTFQSAKADAFDHALARWQATSALQWLVAALSKVEPGHAKASVLQEAAAKIPASSPAFATLSFQRVRLDIAAGRSAEARAKLDDLLQKHSSRFDLSSLNLLHQQRMMVASRLDEFLNYAKRLPAAFSWDENGREIPVDEAELAEEGKPREMKPLFDSDAGEILNRRMPLAVLSRVAVNNRVPDNLRRDITQAVWLRAVLLGDTNSATALVPALKAMVPELTPLLDDYLNARDPAAKKFVAIYAWLKFPGLEPVIDTGVGRGTPLNERDSYRDNWWCTAAWGTPQNDAAGANQADTVPKAAKPTAPSFLTAVQLATAEKEYAALAALGAGPNYLCRQVLDWATKNPGDPRVPEALHLAVSTTRYGCTDKQTGKWSKAAHDFLHRRYPNSPWTKQTPYWFKE